MRCVSGSGFTRHRNSQSKSCWIYHQIIRSRTRVAHADEIAGLPTLPRAASSVAGRYTRSQMACGSRCGACYQYHGTGSSCGHAWLVPRHSEPQPRTCYCMACRYCIESTALEVVEPPSMTGSLHVVGVGARSHTPAGIAGPASLTSKHHKTCLRRRNISRSPKSQHRGRASASHTNEHGGDHGHDVSDG